MQKNFREVLEMKKGRKKVIAAILAGCMALSMAGCGTQTPDSTTQVPEADEAPAAEDTQDTAVSGSVSDGEDVAPADASGEITIWTKDEAISNYDKFLQEKLPDLKINYVVMDDSTIRTKLKAVMSAGATPPDIVLVEIGMWKEMRDLPLWQDLSEFGVADLIGEHYGYIQDLSTDAEGKVVGLTNQATPSGYFYRRSIAKEAFGTDVPEELEAKLADWDSVMATGQELYEKTGLSLFPSIDDIIRMKSNTASKPWIVDDQFVIDDDVIQALELAKEADETHVAGRLEQWGPEWRENFNTAEYSMGLFSATWLMAYDIKSGAPETEGDWGFAEIIAPQFYGGSFFAMPAGAENKESAWEYIKTVTCDHDFLKFFSNDIGDFCANQVVNEEISAANTSDAFLGGQNITQKYSDIAAEADPKAMYDYQGDAIYAVTEAAREYVYNGKTLDEALQVIVDIMAADVPSVEVVIQ